MFDSTSILTPDEIDVLRRRKTGDGALETLALRAAAALFVGGREFVTATGELLYGQGGREDGVHPMDREVQLLTIFTISREWSQLAVHCYWAILVGLHPREIANTLLLACMWAGIDEYVSALGVLTKVLHTLKKLVPTDPTPEDVLAAIQTAF